MSRKIALAAAAGIALMPLMAMGQSGIGAPLTIPAANIITFPAVINILNTAVTWAYTIFMILAVFFAIITAFKYLFSGGNPEKVKAATRSLIYVIVAIGIAMISVSIRYLVANFLGVQIGA